jgi:hypothetical protein
MALDRVAARTRCPDRAATVRLIGRRMFDRHAFVDLFTSAGLIDVAQQIQRTLQFVTAGQPG